MEQFEKPPPYSPEAPPTTTQPSGYQGGAPFPAYPVPAQSNYHIVNPGTLPAYGSTVYIHQPPPTTPQVILVGGCPACRVGVLEDDFTCLGVCLAILFFPIGILCCLAMMQRRCPNCGSVFS